MSGCCTWLYMFLLGLSNSSGNCTAPPVQHLPVIAGGDRQHLVSLMHWWSNHAGVRKVGRQGLQPVCKFGSSACTAWIFERERGACTGMLHNMALLSWWCSGTLEPAWAPWRCCCRRGGGVGARSQPGFTLP